MSNEETMKFYEAYQKLERIAQEMQDAPEKVIDVMEEKLKEAIKLNKFCNERLGKVQTMLDQYKVEANVVPTENIANITEESVMEEKPTVKESFDDDIPF